MIDGNLKVFVHFVEDSPLNKWGENSHLSQLDSLVCTFERKEKFTDTQKIFTDKIVKQFGWDQKLWMRVFQWIAPEFVARKVTEFVKKYIDGIVLAHYNPSRFPEYYPKGQAVKPIPAGTVPEKQEVCGILEMGDLRPKYRKQEVSRFLSQVQELQRQIMKAKLKCNR